jgi:hypothetical protein
LSFGLPGARAWCYDAAMLTIRAAQMKALMASAALGHVPALVRHVQQFHAGNLDKLGAQSVESFVARAVEVAAGHELYSERSLARFLDIAVVRGLPLPAPLEAILCEALPASPAERLDRAWRRLMFELEATS